MLRFDIITAFPQLFDSFVSEGIVSRAQSGKRIAIRVHNLRSATRDRYKTIDDRPYGGGAGMLVKIEPVVATLRRIPKKERKRIIFLTPTGKQLTQSSARRFARGYDQIILICGRYEGVDARIKKYIDEELSVGPYVLNGGEVPAMAVIEAVMRLVPGVLGNIASLEEESFSQGLSEYPQYTRPEVFERYRVPRVLLSGDHKKIAEWRAKKRRVLSPIRG